MSSNGHYQEGYHSAVHGNLIGDDVYFQAVSGASHALYLQPGETNLRILDYGCGVGQFLLGLPNAAGFEISAEGRRHCERRGLRVWGELGEVPRGVWDLVVARHVLEHLESPLDSLVAMRELLAPQGQLLLVLPREPHGAADLHPDVHQHLYCWNFRSLNNLLHRAGYRVESNQELFVRGFGVLLPLYRLGLNRAYLHALKLAGRLVGNAELCVRARRAEPHG